MHQVTFSDPTIQINDTRVVSEFKAWAPRISNIPRFYYHSTPEAVYAAYVNRHKPRVLPEYEPRQIRKCFRYIRPFITDMAPMTYVDYIASFQGSKRAMYQRAYDSVVNKGYYKTSVMHFIKPEKFAVVEQGDGTIKYTAPRLIQARSPEFNLQFGRYIKPLGTWLAKSSRHRWTLGKGTYDTIGERIDALAKRYKYATGGDHKTYDAHNTPEMLRLKHKFYLSCYKHDPELKNILNCMHDNICFDRNGNFYRTYMDAKSGECDTNDGHNLTNYAILRSALSDIGVRDCEIFRCGDDFIIFHNERFNLDTLTSHLRTYNMETKLEPTTENISEVEFCKTKCVYGADGRPTMMAPPRRVIETFGMNYRTDVPYPKYINEIAICNAYIHSSNPIGYHFAMAFGINVDKQHIPELKYVDNDMRYKLSEHKRDRVCNDPTITESMLTAWPDLVNDLELIYQLTVPSVREPVVELTINHDTKTTSCVVGVTQSYA